MIQSFRDKDLKYLWEYGESRKIRNDLIPRILRKLDFMDTLKCVDDLREPASNKLHKLTGDLQDYWVISINGPWRLIFRIEENNIYDLMLEQYH